MSDKEGVCVREREREREYGPIAHRTSLYKHHLTRSSLFVIVARTLQSTLVLQMFRGSREEEKLGTPWLEPAMPDSEPLR